MQRLASKNNTSPVLTYQYNDPHALQQCFGFKGNCRPIERTTYGDEITTLYTADKTKLVISVF